jgi:hypothetical protein
MNFDIKYGNLLLFLNISSYYFLILIFNPILNHQYLRFSVLLCVLSYKKYTKKNSSQTYQTTSLYLQINPPADPVLPFRINKFVNSIFDCFHILYIKNLTPPGYFLTIIKKEELD